MLFAILLFSCDQNNVCIDADDFGDIERETIKVYAGGDDKLDKCSIPESAGANGYEVLADGALKTCLTTDFTISKFITSVNDSEIKVQFDKEALLDKVKDYKPKPSSAFKDPNESNENGLIESLSSDDNRN